jgi:hypothetical protein
MEPDIEGIITDCHVRASREFPNVLSLGYLLQDPVVRLMLRHAIEVAHKEAMESEK